MKTLSKTFFAALLLLGTAGAFTDAQAQVTININPPSWGPAAPAGTQYYYVPEYGGYYDLRAQQYIVQQNGQWMRVASLNGYDPRGFHPVVIDYVGAQPWVYVTQHKAKYGHPHGMPPGQAKKMKGAYVVPAGTNVIVVDDHGGKGKGNGKGKGHGKH
ncbi:hypothetical protein [Hymenobacter jeollabukensis]|uniref:Uncharacterized protein n=1 Tax=Hymenobacter jeollabukensis TaxID=2025313 RepID=A0A5R8WV56_9BACT|nr:hypothetical protein [Hymenobacter jeollabukensis]TLM95284.1 hypothetical protein FDY95_05715 [Hymenobacter jeollabukensis]